MSVIVFGSINMDLVARTPRLPVPGETLSGYSFETIPGGKGANQAVAVARLGIPTQMIGRVGGDRFGRDLIDSLRSSQVNCDGVFTDAETASGVAMIAVDDHSENHIIIIPGANGRVDVTDIDRLQTALSDASVLLLQLEVPIAIVVAAAQAAQQAGVTVILDPAPAQTELPPELYSLVNILTPNQVEAGQLVGFDLDDSESILAAATTLNQRGVDAVLIKLGKRGAFCLSAQGSFEIPAFEVQAIDTVAAGDAFNGGLAAGLA
ncbi:MAG: ribokinase, partial [Microcoleus sp. SIO2G3]|nr:ribokinase [Microcoleus sp. SIO2G3]